MLDCDRTSGIPTTMREGNERKCKKEKNNKQRKNGEMKKLCEVFFLSSYYEWKFEEIMMEEE